MLAAQILPLSRIPISGRNSSPGQHRILYLYSKKRCVEKKEGDFKAFFVMLR